MKSAFPYLVLIALFLAGTRLVNRQQTYTRSIQVSAPPEAGTFTGEPDATPNDTREQSQSRQESRHRGASAYGESSHHHRAADYGLNGASKQPKRVPEAKHQPGKNQ